MRHKTRLFRRDIFNFKIRLNTSACKFILNFTKLTLGEYNWKKHVYPLRSKGFNKFRVIERDRLL